MHPISLLDQNFNTYTLTDFIKGKFNCQEFILELKGMTPWVSEIWV